jgi:hypothetical protein
MGGRGAPFWFDSDADSVRQLYAGVSRRRSSRTRRRLEDWRDVGLGVPGNVAGRWVRTRERGVLRGREASLARGARRFRVLRTSGVRARFHRISVPPLAYAHSHAQTRTAPCGKPTGAVLLPEGAARIRTGDRGFCRTISRRPRVSAPVVFSLRTPSSQLPAVQPSARLDSHDFPPAMQHEMEKRRPAGRPSCMILRASTRRICRRSSGRDRMPS